MGFPGWTRTPQLRNLKKIPVYNLNKTGLELPNMQSSQARPVYKIPAQVFCYSYMTLTNNNNKNLKKLDVQN